MKHEDNEFMQHELRLPELTVRGMLLGAVLTVIFTASNVYLGLKVGLTFSSAIPAAVISMAVLKMAKDSNILENNMVQTQASAAGTLSAIIFIIPGMLMIGYWQGFEFWQTLLVSACGGCLGVLFTIPLRRAMVVHSDLAYPEGVAAAEILKVGSGANEQEGASSGVKEITSGGILAGIIAFCTNALQVLGSELSLWIPVGRGMTQLPLGYSTALVGAGYLIGIAAGLSMLVGILIAWVGFVPYYTITSALPDGMTMQKFAGKLYQDRVRLIGAGAMGVAAIWTLITLARPVIDGVKESLAAMRMPDADKGKHRMDIDMSVKSIALVFFVTVIGLLGIFYAFVSPEGLPMTENLTFVIIGVGVAVLMGFFVAAACAYMAGLVGTSSSPISGIGILAIIVASLVMYGLCSSFGIFALPGGEKFATATAIFTTSIIMAIACISNDNMQDLKTGYLVGATPWRQQVALLLGCVVGAFVIAPVLNLLYEAYGFPGALPRPDMDPSQALAAPQAALMTTIAQGIFSSTLAWEYVYIGLGLGVVLVIVDQLLKRNTRSLCLPPLAVGMGIYLPPSVQTPLVVGAVLGYFLRKHMKAKCGEEQAKEGARRGTLFASGLIVGESIIGVLLAGVIVVSVSNGGSEAPLAIVGKGFANTAEWLGFLAFIVFLGIFSKVVLGAGKKQG
ncbi:OPT family oligopeptide transporter [Mitsuokella sp. AF21-1AC]|uniref:OPT family oligopeptide transporter n=1 Tax=Mitsuokella sp. AF21-1AC TaxID=2292235 RepID=UPI000E4752CA|nr:oligopeptide transporter, OPT family [Mitsuokella sp. AF21-1AC]RGS72548.1 oligopeptide transporter, OPT family [Mitsuokella sp. AF21-1AC]